MRLVGVCLIVAVLWPLGAWAARRPDPEKFPVPKVLETNVAFWHDVFQKYSSRQVVLHDERYVDVIYAVLDFSELEDSDLSAVAKESRRKNAVRKAKRKYEGILADLAAGRQGSPAEDAARVKVMLADLPGGRTIYREAAQRLRTQTGLRDRFEEAIRVSGLYMPAMEAHFRARGLPVALTRMPFVESMFQVRARSKAAAGGIWQIMPSTARGLLEMGLEVDERYDPLRAAEAAATVLSRNFEVLESWPVAVTAYNHGTNGMARAVSRLGTRDIGVIVEQHRSRLFGFASRNFYAEFIAAAAIYDDRERYFPGVEPLPPLAFDEFVPARYVSAKELAAGARATVDELEALNPAVEPSVWRGNLFLPKGLRLRVPEGKVAAFEASYAALSAGRKLQHQIGTRYRVRRGDTLSVIAARFGSSVSIVKRANRLRSDLIRVGQVLRIPARGSVGAAGAGPSSSGVHVVRRGETLTAIARRYGSSVSRIKNANGLASDRIYPGQRLSIPR